MSVKIVKTKISNRRKKTGFENSCRSSTNTAIHNLHLEKETIELVATAAPN